MDEDCFKIEGLENLQNDEKTFVLPDSEEIMRRLVSVNSNQDLVEKYYPVVCERAGLQVNWFGVILILAHCTDELVFLREDRRFMKEYLPRFCEVLIDDPEAQKEAINYLGSLSPSV